MLLFSAATCTSQWKLRRSRANTRLSALLYNVGVLLPLNNVRAIIYYNKLRYADDVVILASTEDNLLALVNIISSLITAAYSNLNEESRVSREPALASRGVA